LVGLSNDGPLMPRAIPACAALLAYAMAARDPRARITASLCGTAFLTVAFWALVPPAAVAPAWALFAVALLLFRASWHSYALAAAAAARCWWFNFDTPTPALAVAAVVACFYTAQLLEPIGSRPRAWFSLLGTKLLLVLLYDQVSGGLLTVAWAVEGV